MRTKAETKKTTDALAILDQMAGGSPELRRLTAEARVNVAVAQLIYAARDKAGLSQAELAERIGTKQSVISRLEDADYEGHSLSMLNRIAKALNQQVQVVMRPKERDLETVRLAFRDVIRGLRKEQGLSVDQLARRIDALPSGIPG